MMNTDLISIASHFVLDGKPSEVTPLGPGFINDTYILTTDKGVRYILQRKNHKIFPDVPGMMDNIRKITNHLKKKVDDPMREVLTPILTPSGALYVNDEAGNFWTMTLFIEGSVTYEKADTAEKARKGGIGIGRFQSLLSDFNEPLVETIKGFHDARYRIGQWDAAVSKDAAGRCSLVKEEILEIESRKEAMMHYWSKIEDGTIPVRVSHNDTKISNILFDSEGQVLCMIDLDTCMATTSLNDFGDAIRSYANSAAEDEADLSKVGLSMELFKAYAEGYMSERKDTISDSELEWLAFSAAYITYEQALRFLMDYIDGDTYYKIRYPQHNLVRARNQLRHLQTIEENLEEMKAFILSCR